MNQRQLVQTERTLTVSIGVTAKIASLMPAPRPHNRRIAGDKLPFSSTARALKYSKAPKLKMTSYCVKKSVQRKHTVLQTLEWSHTRAQRGLCKGLVHPSPQPSSSRSQLVLCRSVSPSVNTPNTLTCSAVELISHRAAVVFSRTL